ncbi:nitrate- and nitrite sensing domain-containing protein [Streptomyces sp. NPDC005805]|uniref:nitrate- and nitrite sensing domain-containing protein n=1 Tax=Streptomyces sp. NPDC005805 TaxID=3157068 RepID=UPI0034034F3E
MQKKRPRGKGGTPTANAGESGESQAPAPARTAPQDAPTPGGRPVRVRRRLVAGVTVAGVLVVGAGAPGILAASADLTESQRLVTLAALDRQAVTLAHSLADERDEVVAYLAAGGEAQKGDAKDRRTLSEALAARVDRQVDEMRAETGSDHADLNRSLASVPSLRRTALSDDSTPMEAHRAYTAVIDRLQALSYELAEKTPPRAADGTRAPAALGHAVEQASAARGLLLAALSVPKPPTQLTYDPITGLPVETEGEDSQAAARTRDALTAAAQQARVRELAALADFDQAAAKSARDRLAATVTGPEVRTAEGYLARLTDQPRLISGERGTDRAKLEAALTARIEQMRGAETTLAAGRITAFEQLRDDDVTALEVRVALVGGLLLVTVGVLAAVSRTLTRPLAVLRIGAARLAESPQTEEPVRFTGRNDEFAQVVRSLNALHGQLRDLGARVARLDGEHGELSASRETLGSELAAARAELGERTGELTAELERLRHTVHHTFVNLSLRTLGLVERQLGVIEKLEEREQDPERLATLFKLDHMATVMRRHSENLLVLAGAEHGQGHVGPVPLVDVLRAAVSEIERYDRVVIQSLPPHAQVAGFAADDLSHLVAELLENATSFSPPDAQVEMSGWLLESGEVMLSVQDAGIGMTAARIDEVNALLAEPAAHETPAARETEGLGLRVAGLLAARHGVRVQLREHKQGGITAVVVVPAALLPQGPPAATAQQVAVAGRAPALHLPGSVAEANSNALPANPRRGGGGAEGAGAAPGDAAVDADMSAEAPDPGADTDAPAGAEPGPEALAGTEGESRADAETAAEAAQEDRDGADADTRVDAGGGAAAGADVADVDAEERLPASDPFVEAAERAVRAAAAERDTHERPDETDEPDGIDQATVTMRLPRQPGPEDADVDAGTMSAGHTGSDHVSSDHTESDHMGAAHTASDHMSSDTTASDDHTGGHDTGADHMSAAHTSPDHTAPAHTSSDHTAPAHTAPDHMDATPTPTGGPGWDRVTDKGLPKRTPRLVEPAAPAERSGSVDAEALRRRLGGFQQGARDGRRDAEAELAAAPEGTAPEETAAGTPAADRTDQRAHMARETGTEAGDTVEEARR